MTEYFKLKQLYKDLSTLNLSTAEKLQVMETLWQELTAEGAEPLASHAWHQQALQQTENAAREEDENKGSYCGNLPCTIIEQLNQHPNSDKYYLFFLYSFSVF